MPGRTIAAGGIVEFSWVSFGVGNQVSHRFDAGLFRECGRNNENVGRRSDERYGLEVALRIVGQLLIKRRIDGKRRHRAHHKRVAVTLGVTHVAHADIAAGTRAVFHDNRAKYRRNRISNSAGRNVERASRRIRHNDADGIAAFAFERRLGGQRKGCGSCECHRSDGAQHSTTLHDESFFAKKLFLILKNFDFSKDDAVILRVDGALNY